MRLLLFSALAMSILGSNAQSKINLMGRAQLRELKSIAIAKDTEATPVMVEAIITFKDGTDIDLLESYGAQDITDIFENVVTASLPADRVEAFAACDAVEYVDFGNTYHAMLDFARPSCNVPQVQEGFELSGSTVSFTGKGVVTGLMDEGIDPNHINFTDAAGTCRVKQVFDFDHNISATTARAVKQFTCDYSSKTHGTHVAGIMAGSYNGNSDYTFMNSPTDRIGQSASGNMPYYGVATGSEIVMCAGSLTNANILKGIKAIVDYASAAGMPAVVNLSLGSNNGPHDGSEALEQSISKYAKDAVICISAGNEGDHNMFAGKELTDDDNVMKTIVVDGKSSGIDIWTNGPEPVTVSIGFYASLTRKFTPFATVTEAGQSVQANSSFTSSMKGSCVLSSDVDVRNNRYHVLVSGTFEPGTARNNVALYIEGKAGQEIYVYGYGDYSTSFTSSGIAGFTDGTNDGTINGLACAEGVIAVGAFTTRTSWPTFAGDYYYTGSTFKVDAISPFSSYGTTYQGVELPQITAPGAAIISSLNRYYTNTLDATSLKQNTSAKVVPSSGLTNYWGEMQGTSMSCPFVSGTVALWLEADPTLTTDRIIEIFKATSVDMSGGDSQLAKRWGAGKIDALAGIKKVLDDKASVGAVFADDERNFIITPVDGGYNVYVAGENVLTVGIHDMSGRLVARAAAANDNNVDIATSQLPKGIYVVTATGNNSRYSRKIVL